MEKNKIPMRSIGSASLESGVGIKEEGKCIVLEQNIPFAFGHGLDTIRFVYHALLMSICAPAASVELVSSLVITQ